MGISGRSALFALACAGFASACSMAPSFSPLSDSAGGGSAFSDPKSYPGKTGVPEGILGGHFDLDTSHLVYQPSNGTTDHHVHEYDKAHATTSIDFFSLLDSKFNEIDQAILSQRFILIAANAQLSPGGVLQINESLFGVLPYQKQTQHQVFTLGAPQSAGDQQLKSLKLGFSQDILAKNGLVPTVTGCVRSNDPGKNGEYRNGALVIQALDATQYQLDPATGVAAAVAGGLLWEATVFWHWDGPCY